MNLLNIIKNRYMSPEKEDNIVLPPDNGTSGKINENKNIENAGVSVPVPIKIEYIWFEGI